jgi:hypothetical protein
MPALPDPTFQCQLPSIISMEHWFVAASSLCNSCVQLGMDPSKNNHVSASVGNFWGLFNWHLPNLRFVNMEMTPGHQSLFGMDSIPRLLLPSDTLPGEER